MRAAAYRKFGLERIAAFVLVAGSLALAAEASSFSRYSSTSTFPNLVQFSPKAYVADYTAAFSILTFLLSVVIFPFRGGSILQTRIRPWAAGLNDSSLQNLRLRGPLLALCIAVVTGAFLFARMAFLSSISGPDQGLYRSAALQIFSGTKCPLPLYGEDACNLEHPPLAKLLIAASMELFGKTIYASRLPSVLLGTLTIPLASYVMWALTKNRTATVLTACLLCLDPMFFAWTTIGNLDTVEIFLTTAAVAFYVSGSRGPVNAVAAGALMGLAVLSKEVAVLGLAALVTYHLVSSEKGRLKYTSLILGSAFGTFAVGLQVYDSLFTQYPNFLAHMSYMLYFGFHEVLTWSNPLYWLISIAAESWGTYYILNIFASALALIWLPIGIWRIRRAGGEARALILASLWLIWTYVPYEIFYLAGRVEYYYYAVQMVPALALGGAYLLASGGFPKSLKALVILGSIVWFILFFPPDQSFLPQAFKP